jgi:hypothetical protein
MVFNYVVQQWREPGLRAHPKNLGRKYFFSLTRMRLKADGGKVETWRSVIAN